MDYVIKSYELFRAPDAENRNSDTLFWRYPKNNNLYKLDLTNSSTVMGYSWTIVREAGENGPVVMAYNTGFQLFSNNLRAGNGTLIVSLNGAPSQLSWIIHSDDDDPHRYYGAVDTGNSSSMPVQIQEQFQRGIKIPYFILKASDLYGCPVPYWGSLRIANLKQKGINNVNIRGMLSTYYPYLPMHINPGPYAEWWMDIHDSGRSIKNVVKAGLIHKLKMVVLNPFGFDNHPRGSNIEYHGIFYSDNSLQPDGRKYVDKGLLEGALNDYTTKHLASVKEYAKRLKSNGVLIIGYVYTGWFGEENGPEYETNRPLDQVKKNVDDWYETFKNLDGIFFDEVSQHPKLAGTDHEWEVIKNDPTRHSELPYRALFEYVKQKTNGKGLVVLNASNWHDVEGIYESPIGGGHHTHYKGNELYMNACDILGSYEGPFNSYQHDPGTVNYDPGDSGRYKNVSWSLKYESNRFLHLINKTTTQLNALEAVRLAKKRGAGYVYVFDLETELPDYYIEVLDELNGI